MTLILIIHPGYNHNWSRSAACKVAWTHVRRAEAVIYKSISISKLVLLCTLFKKKKNALKNQHAGQEIRLNYSESGLVHERVHETLKKGSAAAQTQQINQDQISRTEQREAICLHTCIHAVNKVCIKRVILRL